jgi:hypothetical protein
VRVARIQVDPDPTDVAELRAMLAEFNRLARTNSARAEELEPELLGLAQDIFPEHEDHILAPEDVSALLDAYA